MLDKIRDIISGLNVTKNNTTLTTGKDTELQMPELNTMVKKLIRKSQKREDFSLTDINLLLTYCLGESKLNTTTFKFHDSLAKNMVFALKSVYIVLDKEDNVIDLRFGMGEILLGTSIRLEVSVKDLKELMIPVDFKIDPKHIH